MPLFRKKSKYTTYATRKRSKPLSSRKKRPIKNSTRKRKSFTHSTSNATLFNSKRTRRRVKRKVAILVYSLLLLLFAGVAFGGFLAYKFINAPFSSAAYTDYTDTKRVWNDDEVTLIIAQLDDINDPYSEVDKLGIVYFDVPSNRYVIYKIPVDVEIEYALNYGKGPFRRIYAVGNADQNRGVYLMQETMLKIFAIHTHGYIFTDEKGYSQFENLIGEINPDDLSASLRLKNFPRIPQIISSIRNNCITNLKFKDIMAVERFIRGTSYNSGTVIELNKYSLLDSTIWDSWWQDRRDLSKVKEEGVKVFIANASKDPKIPGLADWGSRIVKNIGADVLEDDNSFVELSENTIITSNPELLTVKKLAETLKIKNIITIDEIPNDGTYNPQVYRTKVSLFLTSF